MKQLSIINVSYELLEKLIVLPDGCEIKEIIHGEYERKRQVLQIVIKYDKLPKVPEGTEIPWISIEGIKELS